MAPAIGYLKITMNAPSPARVPSCGGPARPTIIRPAGRPLRHLPSLPPLGWPPPPSHPPSCSSRPTLALVFASIKGEMECQKVEKMRGAETM
ncbi:hypothetical protein F751_6602 [Auxenochlorella protothecoides]|uniref:Uncharacterized protein n=1 Tax=Auxenochlorella protothecoides TaxID=3075 RepID=A0A087SPG7_AUXPR|nr:hypothetical protein F751_6602 [Auxenochlorella protothecoides]KFM27621.1 hypothetical protein F751_6602 [Auxenochlorella protothecoides]